MDKPIKERGIIFNGEMVRAILDGSKTQTRRIVKVKPEYDQLGLRFITDSSNPSKIGKYIWTESNATGHIQRSKPFKCPFGKVGDHLWVRETWAEAGGSSPELQLYRANYPTHVPSKYENVPPSESIRWTPSIHMPRWASRITLEITDIRVERLQAITLGDICKEIGCGLYDFKPATHGFSVWEDTWKSIYGQDSWQSNPFVWVVEFKRVEAV